MEDPIDVGVLYYFTRLDLAPPSFLKLPCHVGFRVHGVGPCRVAGRLRESATSRTTNATNKGDDGKPGWSMNRRSAGLGLRVKGSTCIRVNEGRFPPPWSCSFAARLPFLACCSAFCGTASVAAQSPPKFHASSHVCPDCHSWLAL